MINKEDIITCESYKPLCDYVYRPENTDPPSGVVHVNFEELLQFFSAISHYPDRKYIIVSSCSDFGLAFQERNPVWADMPKWARVMVTPDIGYKQAVIAPRCDIDRCDISHKYSVKCYSFTAYTFASIPPQVVHWFMTNSYIHGSEDSRITIIPFGVASNSQQAIMEVAEETSKWAIKEPKLYINWVNYTVDRMDIREDYRKLRSSDIVILYNEKPYKDYLRDLARYSCIMSPEGNGLDCYRNLESIYMDSMPILPLNPTSISLADLPLAVVGSMYGLRPHELHGYYLKFKEQERSLDMAKLSYWKRAFEEKRGLL